MPPRLSRGLSAPLPDSRTGGRGSRVVTSCDDRSSSHPPQGPALHLAFDGGLRQPGPVRWGVLAVTALALALGGWGPTAPQPVVPRALPGWPLYERLCLPCHGSDGDGRGPA